MAYVFKSDPRTGSPRFLETHEGKGKHTLQGRATDAEKEVVVENKGTKHIPDQVKHLKNTLGLQMRVRVRVRPRPGEQGQERPVGIDLGDFRDGQAFRLGCAPKSDKLDLLVVEYFLLRAELPYPRSIIPQLKYSTDLLVANKHLSHGMQGMANACGK